MPCERPSVFLEIICARKMAPTSLSSILGILCVVTLSNILVCEGQYYQFRNYETTTTPILPFPTCRADNIECLRRGLRTFFFLMDSGVVGMKSVDPLTINSVTVALPNEQMSLLMRRVNVTGAKWSKLADRKFNLPGGKNGVQFASNLHVTGEITMSMAGRIDPFVAYITMDLQEIESNITYAATGQRGYDNEDYIFIGPERVAVRNTRLPTFFMQPDTSRAEARSNNTAYTQDALMIEQALTSRAPVIDHLSNEITIALMHAIVDNFRLFASKVPVRNYYNFNK